MNDDGADLPPLSPRAAWALMLWAVAAIALHLAVRELGLRVPSFTPFSP